MNVCREKKLTNMRAGDGREKMILKPPRQFTLELALEYIEDDELVEITPNAIRPAEGAPEGKRPEEVRAAEGVKCFQPRRGAMQ